MDGRPTGDQRGPNWIEPDLTVPWRLRVLWASRGRYRKLKYAVARGAIDAAVWLLGDRHEGRAERLHSGRTIAVGYLSVPLGLADHSDWNVLTADLVRLHDPAPPWPLVPECFRSHKPGHRCEQCQPTHFHRWAAWYPPTDQVVPTVQSRMGVPVRCRTCGARKCDFDGCDQRRHDHVHDNEGRAVPHG